MVERDLVAQVDHVEFGSETLYELIGAIASSPDLDRVLAGVVRVLTDAADCHACFIYLRHGNRLTMRAASRIYAHLVGEVEFSVQEGLAGWVLRHNRPAFIRENALADPRTIYVAELDEERFQSMVAVPVPARDGTVMGVIILHTIAPREFEQGTLNFLTHAAPLVAGVIENAQLYDEAQRRVASLTALAALSQQIAAVEDRAGLYRTASEGVRSLLGCEEARMYEIEVDNHELQLVAAAPVQALAAGAPAVHGQAVLFELLQRRAHAEGSVERMRETFSLGACVEHVLAVPIVAGEEHLGVLVAASSASMSEEAEELLRAAANQVAVALKKAQLIEHLTEENIVCDLFEALSRGDLDQAAARAEQARFDLMGPHLIVEALQGAGAAPESWTARANRVEAGLRRIEPRALCDAGANRLRALLPVAGRGARELKQLDETLQALGSSCGVAIGRSEVHCGAAHGGTAMREAADAASVAKVLSRHGGVRSYTELGVYRYLVHLLEEEVPRDRHLDAIEAIAEYDRRRGGQLLLTLERYLADRCGIAETARALTVHPNTLRQRLERIEALTGLDISREDLLSLELALKIARLTNSPR